MDHDILLLVMADHLPVLGPLGGPVLAFPLESIRREESILVTVFLNVAILFEGDEENDLFANRNEAHLPNSCGEGQAEERWDFFPTVGAPEFYGRRHGRSLVGWTNAVAFLHRFNNHLVVGARTARVIPKPLR